MEYKRLVKEYRNGDLQGRPRGLAKDNVGVMIGIEYKREGIRIGDNEGGEGILGEWNSI